MDNGDVVYEDREDDVLACCQFDKRKLAVYINSFVVNIAVNCIMIHGLVWCGLRLIIVRVT